ncbi:MAG: TonB family protein [Desulfoarculaceae bacterium]|nr:TonB family protein [Desulfoarculaceae bacterium]
MSRIIPRPESGIYPASSPVSSWWPLLRPTPGMSFWPIAFLVSLILHGLLGWWGVSSLLVFAPAKEKVRVTKISFEREQPAKPQPLPIPTQPVSKPVTIPKAVIKAKPEKMKKVVPVVDQQRVSMIEPRQEIVPQPDVLSPPQETAVVQPVLPSSVAPLDVEARQQYLAELFAHLEAHKYYPAAARRRRLEGKVLVSFTILRDGSIRDLRLTGGQLRLREAAQQSVERSLPLPLPRNEIPTPLSINFQMDFRMR